MADRTTLIEKLNTVLSWELAGIIQNLNHAMMVTGRERLTFADFFSDNSKENRSHAEAVGNRIAALGGVPTVEPARIKQAASLDAMLEAALELEEAAMAAWLEALDAAEGAHLQTKLWIEEMVAEEQEHIDELMKITGRISFAGLQLPGASTKAG